MHPAFILIVLVAGVVLLAGVAGLVLLIVGLVKRRAALWVAGIVGIALALLVLVVAVPLGWLLCGAHGGVSPFPPDELTRPAEAGNYAHVTDGRGSARIEGVAFDVLQVRGNGSSFSSSSSTSLLPRRTQARYEVRLGDVRIVVEGRDGRLTFSVNGRPCGRVEPGDRVTVTEDRAVLINDQPVGDGPRPQAPERDDWE
jgi:hypothetical protein